MNWQREALAAMMLVLFVAISHLQVTITEADCLEECSAEAITSFTEEELQEALFTHTLTEDHCMWMHDQRINWQIDVERK